MALREALDEYCALVAAEGFSLVRNTGGDFNPSPEQQQVLRRFPTSLTSLLEWSNGAAWVREGVSNPFLMGWVFDGFGRGFADFVSLVDVDREMNEAYADGPPMLEAVFPIFGEVENCCFGFRPDTSREELSYFSLGAPTKDTGMTLEDLIGMARECISACVKADSSFWDTSYFDITFCQEMYLRLKLDD